MGNMCGGATETPGGAQKNKIRTITTDISTPKDPREVNKQESWRKNVLAEEVLVKSMHPHVLKKFKSNESVSPNTLSIEKKYDSYGEEVDENKWLCNGADPSLGFKDGCKSGQTDFDHHDGTEGWQCPDRENCDFDICEMCIRWVLHCEKNKLDLGWA